MIDVESYRGTVYPWHCDFNNHMNVQHYVGKFDEATWHFMAFLGITPQYLKENNRGMVAAEQNLKYYKEVLSGDLIHIKTELLEFNRKTIIFIHKMYQSVENVLVADGRMVAIHLDLASRKSVEIPEPIYKLGNDYIKEIK